MSSWLAVTIVLVVACFAVGAWKRFTFAKTLRVMRWALCHPVKVFTSTYDREQER